MKRGWSFVGILILLALISVACGREPTIIEVTVPVRVTVEVPASPIPSPTETSPPTATPAPTLTASPTLAPIRATVKALGAQVTVVPGENSSGTGIAPDDYAGLLDQGCRIVQDNYVRGDFNGLDWEGICEEYRTTVQQIDDQEAFWDLMESLVRELGDNHSRFVRPERFAAEFNLPVEGQGIPWPGLSIWPAREEENVTLWDVCQFGPAASAGLQRGDIVLAINGISLEPGADGFDQQAISSALYGQGNAAVLTVRRGPGSEPEEITLEFGGASGCDGWSYGLALRRPRIGYIRVPSFGGGSDVNIERAIELLEEDQPLEGLILDIRHNGGGNSDRDVAIFTTGTFGRLGKLREDSRLTLFRVRGPVRWNENTPVALITDGNSHSASEYFATAMQQSGRAVLVGMPTAGNTEGISGFNLADGSLIRLAISTIILPDGSSLEGTGVIPDILVPLGEWGLREQPDVQLSAALDVLLEQIDQGE